jgi:CBS domain-containing protein
MRVAEAMTKDVCIADPDQSIFEVAQTMEEMDTGVIPVGENDQLVGMITDRDIAIRAVGACKGPDTPVREVMTPEVKYCYDDEELDNVARNMAGLRLRRLPVLNRKKRLVGILSMADVGLMGSGRIAGDAVSGVSRPGGPHSQSAEVESP